MDKSMFVRVAPRDGLVAILSSEGRAESVYDIDGNLVPGGIAGMRVLDDFETAIVPVRDVNEAIAVLRLRQDMSACLDMVLMLFDTRISLLTRKKLALSISTLLGDASILNYVQDILYSRPLPNVADHEGATTAARGIASTSLFVRTLVQKQPIVQLIYDAWLAANREFGFGKTEQDRASAFLLRGGFFRRVVLEVCEHQDLERLWSNITERQDLEEQYIAINLLKTLFQRIDLVAPQVFESNARSSWEGDFICILSQYLDAQESSTHTDAIVARVRSLAEHVQQHLPESGGHSIAVAELIHGFSELKTSIQDQIGFLKGLCHWAGLDAHGFSRAEMQQIRDLAFLKNSAEDLADWFIKVNSRKSAKAPGVDAQQSNPASADALRASGEQMSE